MKRIFVAGHRGMVGSAIARKLSQSEVELVYIDRRDVDLTNKTDTYAFLQDSDIDEIYLAAAKVGGIKANNEYPADFLVENLEIQTNVISGAFNAKIKKLLFLGSSCIYPKYSAQPIKEDSLLSGQLEPTNEPYAIAKIAGIKMCESFNRQFGTDYRSVMPTNLYGPGDNFHLENSHVVPALIRKFEEAKLRKVSTVSVWGTGGARREFLHVDDMADACIHLMSVEQDRLHKEAAVRNSHVNIGTGSDITIASLASTIADLIGFNGEIRYDTTKPDGTPRKLLDTSKINRLEWSPKIDLVTGLTTTIEWFRANYSDLRSQ